MRQNTLRVRLLGGLDLWLGDQPFVRPAILGSATVPAAAPRAPLDGGRPTVAPPRAARPAG
jgi:hypothetical protein